MERSKYGMILCALQMLLLDIASESVDKSNELIHRKYMISILML